MRMDELAGEEQKHTEIEYHANYYDNANDDTDHDDDEDDHHDHEHEHGHDEFESFIVNRGEITDAAAFTAQVTRWTFASNLTPDIPRGSFTPSCESMTYS